ncbi:hypothetical protein SDC9_58298 [bioreactor metagenome]|jgi:tetratricopeptide (TPR) repeat protein|uniref:Tetratricopeptide repeat protein n=2 Tax=root TaxID=1 RepID=A0A644X7N9_9ZZZZ
MRRTFCFGTWIILLLWVVPVFSDILPAWGNGVIVTEPEGSASKPKPAKKTPPPKSTAPVAKKEMRQIQEPLPKINISLQQGLVLLEQRYFTRATPLLERAVLEEPGNPAAWHALGRTYHERGLFSRAQEAYKKALEAHPGYPPLSRILPYPSEDGRKPLWDPKRPGRIEVLPAAAGGFTILSPEQLPAPQGKAPLYNPPLPPESAEKEPQIPPAPETSPVHRQAHSGRGNAKLHPFVPVRIVIAPQSEENEERAEKDIVEPQAAAPDTLGPAYVPPAPPEGKTD